MSENFKLVRELLLKELETKIKPFGYGEEEGCEGYPRWYVYVDVDGRIYHNDNLVKNFDKVCLSELAAVAENAVCGQMLFKEILDIEGLASKMGYIAQEAAKKWEAGAKLTKTSIRKNSNQ